MKPLLLARRIAGFIVAIAGFSVLMSFTAALVPIAFFVFIGSLAWAALYGGTFYDPLEHSHFVFHKWANFCRRIGGVSKPPEIDPP